MVTVWKDWDEDITVYNVDSLCFNEIAMVFMLTLCVEIYTVLMVYYDGLCVEYLYLVEKNDSVG